MLQQITAAGCKQDGELYQSLLKSAQPNNYAAGLVNTLSYKKYQQLANAPLLESVVKDGSTTKTVALNNFQQLNRESSTVNTSALNFASRDLCLKAGIMNTYDQCLELTDSSPAPFNLICMQREFRRQGGQPAGTQYPTITNKAKYDALGTWGAFKSTINKLSKTAFAKEDGFIDSKTQRNALKQFLGIIKDPIDYTYTAGDLQTPGTFYDSGGATQRFRLWINKLIDIGRTSDFIDYAKKQFDEGNTMKITVTRLKDKNIRTFILTTFTDGGYYWEVTSTGRDAYQYGQYYADGDEVDFTFTVVPPPYNDLGCWGDAWDRALKSPSMRGNTVASCFEKARAGKFNYFSVQDGDECYVGNSGYNKYGRTSGDCPPTGGPWKAHVYQVTNTS
jgi:hypothetical protein